jgi:SAM-dependent methyltransferase
MLLASSLPFERALDVGCGPGGSTQALEALASWTVGIDPSLPMLRHAESRHQTSYAAARGENLPFHTGTFDLLTVSSAFHWFNRKAFLSEAGRVLRPAGILVVYDNYFSGSALETDELGRWVYAVYRSKYPAPARGSIDFGPGTIKDGFRVLRGDEYENEVEFTLEELVSYLLTQTNVIAAVEEGDQSVEDVKEWLRRELQSYFASGPLTVRFGGPIWILAAEKIARELP